MRENLKGLVIKKAQVYKTHYHLYKNCICTYVHTFIHTHTHTHTMYICRLSVSRQKHKMYSSDPEANQGTWGMRLNFHYTLS